ncbi:IS3 family transposase [Candidatus Mycoplasma pogonae]
MIIQLYKKYKLKNLLKAAKISKSVYYYWASKLSYDKDNEVKEEILIIFTKHFERYGYRGIHAELKRKMVINTKKVRRLMKEIGLIAVKKTKRKLITYRGQISKISPNHLLVAQANDDINKNQKTRDFSTTKTNQKWVTDVTQFSFKEQKIFLSPIMDLHTREIIAYDISKSPDFKQIKKMLQQAFNKFNNLKGLIFHSDQGWQYQMKKYQNALEEKGIIQSMSRKGNCLDNSIMENFFGILKREMFYGHEHEFEDIEDFN